MARADRISDFAAAVAYDNNLSNGQLRSDTHGDLLSTVTASQGVFIPVGDYDDVTLTGDLRAQSFDRFSGMNNLSLGATLAYRRKFGLGPMAPSLSISGSTAHLDFANDIRNGWQYNVGARFSKRLDDHWDVNAGIRVDQRTGRQAAPLLPGISGDVFGVSGRNLSLGTSYAWSDKTLFSLDYGYRNGDVVSTTQPNRTIFFASAAITRDPVFGAGEIAYRLHAASQLASVHASQALGENSSLNLGLQRQLTRGDGGNNYAKNIVELSYLYNF